MEYRLSKSTDSTKTQPSIEYGGQLIIIFGGSYCHLAYENREKQITNYKNEANEAKIPMTVAWGNNGFLFGKAADSQYLDNYKNTVLEIPRILGKSYSKASRYFDEYDLECDNRYDQIRIKLPSNSSHSFTYTPEQLVAKILQFMVSTAEDYWKLKFSSVSIVYPIGFDQDQRAGLKKAITLANLDILIPDHCIIPDAVTIMSGCFRRNTRSTLDEKLLFVDINMFGTTIALMESKNGTIKSVFTLNDTLFSVYSFVDVLFYQVAAKYIRDSPENVDLPTFYSKKIYDSFYDETKSLFLGKILTLSPKSIFPQADYELEITPDSFQKNIEFLLEYLINIIQQKLADTNTPIHSISKIYINCSDVQYEFIKQKLKEVFDEKLIFEYLFFFSIVGALKNSCEKTTYELSEPQQASEIFGNLINESMNKLPISVSLCEKHTFTLEKPDHDNSTEINLNSDFCGDNVLLTPKPETTQDVFSNKTHMINTPLTDNQNTDINIQTNDNSITVPDNGIAVPDNQKDIVFLDNRVHVVNDDE